MIDDARDAVRSERPPESHRARLDDGVRTLCRYMLVIVLALSAVADLLGLVG